MSNRVNKYEIIIGLEIHLQLKTKSKMFCSCANEDDKPVNTLVCPICLGHPGTLPTLNSEAVKQGLAMALALQAQINRRSKFDRKNYFYPDLPKGYQISQYDEPLASGGYLLLSSDGHKRRIAIERLHLEEDAAKNIHKNRQTLTDFNRAGTPLVEIVTKPDFRSPPEAKEFLQELRLIARYLGVSEADMEKGHMRCDANISLRPIGDQKFYPKTEVKNINSFRAVERALLYEIDRQTKLWDKKQAPQITETRGWDEDKGETVSQRSKEDSADYRYFPEPDLPPLVISEELIQEAQSKMGELPQAKEERFAQEYGLNSKDARILIKQKEWANYFEELMSELQGWLFDRHDLGADSQQAIQLWEKEKSKLSRLAFSWITTELFALRSISGESAKFPISAENLAELLTLLYENRINSSAGQTILQRMYSGADDDPHHIAESLDLMQIDDEASLNDLVIKVVMSNPEQVKKYQAGKEALLKFFVGQVMKESKGKANPQIIEKIIKEKLKK